MDSGEHFKMTTSSSISVDKKTVIIEVGCGPPVIPSLSRRCRQVAESFNENSIFFIRSMASLWGVLKRQPKVELPMSFNKYQRRLLNTRELIWPSGVNKSLALASSVASAYEYFRGSPCWSLVGLRMDICLTISLYLRPDSTPFFTELNIIRNA